MCLHVSMNDFYIIIIFSHMNSEVKPGPGFAKQLM